jgi:hypothetical protein
MFHILEVPNVLSDVIKAVKFCINVSISFLLSVKKVFNERFQTDWSQINNILEYDRVKNELW